MHQLTALAGLVAIAVHAITLLGDRFLAPSIGDIALPFTSAHEPLWTGLGVTGGWLAAILGLSFWLRHRIGAALWRRLHRATVLVYLLSVAHTLGAGTDASQPWMRALLLITGAPILFLFLMRVLTPKHRPARPRFRPFRVTGVHPESSSVTSFHLAPADGEPPLPFEPGRFVTLRTALAGGERALRSYSLSAAPSAAGHRISVKREPGGRVSEHLHDAVAIGDVLELGAPGGRLVIGADHDRALALISAGIGATPLLESLAHGSSEREVWWVHGARNGDEHAFGGEARSHLARLRHGHGHVRYSRPRERDRLGADYDAAGRLSAEAIIALGVPAGADVGLCGPSRFVADLSAGLLACGVARERIQSESFGGAPAASATARPAAAAGARPSVAFARSGVTATWSPSFVSLLELAEASAVTVGSGCGIGSCHGCSAEVISGSVRHDRQPLEAPAPGRALLCCAVPQGDVVLDA